MNQPTLNSYSSSNSTSPNDFHQRQPLLQEARDTSGWADEEDDSSLEQIEVLKVRENHVLMKFIPCPL